MMLLRLTTMRGLLVLIITLIITYTIFLQWLFSGGSHYHADNIPFSSSASLTSEKEQPSSPPSIFTHTPMHDELANIQFRPLR
jgi:hypothetical protein